MPRKKDAFSRRLELGHQLRQLREASGLTQSEVAAELKYCSGQFISNWERGRSTPPPSAFETLASIYKVSRATIVNLVFDAERDVLEYQRREALAGRLGA